MPEITWNDIVRKLTSRKFWMAVAAFVTGVLQFNGASEDTIAQIGGLILAGAAVVAYIIGEGLADAAPTINEDNWYFDPNEIKEVE